MAGDTSSDLSGTVTGGGEIVRGRVPKEATEREQKAVRAQMRAQDAMEKAVAAAERILDSTEFDEKGRPVFSGADMMTAAKFIMSAASHKTMIDMELGLARKKGEEKGPKNQTVNNLFYMDGMSEAEKDVVRKIALRAAGTPALPEPTKGGGS
jgi:hypothetical protein